MLDPGPNDLARCHAYLSGRVQGVGMRATIQILAQQMKLVGWVRNMDDGRVEALVQGPRVEIERLWKKLQEHRAGLIATLSQIWEPVGTEYHSFDINP